jgi:hypothetical protein
MPNFLAIPKVSGLALGILYVAPMTVNTDFYDGDEMAFILTPLL